MKYLIFLFLSITNAIYNYNYDKYINKDISSLLLKNMERPFYSSKYYYSSHYIKMDLNKSNFTQK